MLKRKNNLSKKDVLKVIPERNPYIKWEKNEENLIILTVPIKEDWYTKIAKKFLKTIPETRLISLDDEVASSVWDACDGKRNVNDIINIVCNKYKLQRRQSEMSTTLFLQTLSKKNLIVLKYSGGKTKSGK